MSVFTEDELIELGLLRALEVDERVSSGFLPEEQRFDDSSLKGLYFSYPELKFHTITGDAYPAQQLSFDIENLALPRLQFDPLRTQLREIVSDETVVNNYEKWSETEDGDVFKFKTALHLVQTMQDFLEKLQHPETVAEEINYKKNDHIPDLGIDLSTVQVNASALDILGKTLEEICEEIPEEFRVLHVESVIRSDKYCDFIKCQDRIRERTHKNISIEELRNTRRDTINIVGVDGANDPH